LLLDDRETESKHHRRFNPSKTPLMGGGEQQQREAERNRLINVIVF
jgi:hypothetical protein